MSKAVSILPVVQEFKIGTVFGDETIVCRIPPGFKKAGEKEHYGHVFDQLANDARQTDILYTLTSKSGSRRTVSQTDLKAEVGELADA